MTDSKIPIIMCIDVEPDGFFIDRTKPLPWKGYEGAHLYFSELRSKIASVTGTPVHFSWFYRVDPQVAETYGSAGWALTHYSEFLNEFLQEGDEIGLHPHAYRWVPELNHWVEDMGNQSWVNYCVETAFDHYRRILGRVCESFRFGAYWISEETINLAERLGARFDLTVEPEFKIKKKLFPDHFYTGSLPDYDRVPRMPYRPSRSDFTKPDPARNEGIWIIPMSTGTVMYRYGRLETELKKIFSPDDLKSKSVTLNLARGVNGFQSVMNGLLNSLEKPYLAFVIRSDICNGEAVTKNDRENMAKNLDFILNHPSAGRFVFSTPSEAMSLLGYLDAKPAEAGV